MKTSRAALALLVLLAPLVPPPAAATDLLHWASWATDPLGDAKLVDGGVGSAPSPDHRVDLSRLDVAADGARLHVRLLSPGAAQPTDSKVPAPEVHLEATVAGQGNFSITSTDGILSFHRGGADVPAGSYGVSDGALPWNFTAWVDLGSIGAPTKGALRLDGVHVSLAGPSGSDRMDGAPLTIDAQGQAVGAVSAVQGTWLEATGPDFAGGTSVAAGPDGAIHVVYFVYSKDRGTPVGLYHAVVGDSWQATRVGDFSPVPGARDDQERTKVAVSDDGTVHVLYLPCPDQACGTGLRYLRSGATWTSEDPSAGAKVGNGHRDVPALVAGHGRVVAALPDGHDNLTLVERGASGWHVLTSVPQARLPRLAIGPDGKLGLAFFRPVPGMHDQVDGGDLMVASEADAWRPRFAVHGIEDQSGFWDVEVDGSFGFALDPQGHACFAYDAWLDARRTTGQPERGFGCLDEQGVRLEPAPLVPSHGNPSLAIRLAFDAAGNAHIGTGYGGTDLYAVRRPDATWAVQAIARHDMWDLAVSPAGVPVFAYTQPHGGTTAAVSVLQQGPLEGAFKAYHGEDQPHAGSGRYPPLALPAPSVAFAVALLAVAGVRRRGALPRES